MGESPSTMKDAGLSASGSMAALGHLAAGHEVLKNAVANLVVENCEIAAYMSFLASGRAAGHADAIPLLEMNLDEEHAMARWVEEHIPAVTET